MTGPLPSSPLVSIVSPTLNQGQLIEGTLRSVKTQTYSNLEHIVVDGGSSDGTLELLRRYEPTYPLRWISEPDRGMYDAVNKGLALSRGEILAYLNSDDLYFPWTVATVVDFFRRNPGTDFVFGDALSVDDETNSQRFYWTPPFDLEYLRQVGFLAQPTVFWRRRAYQCEGDFDTTLRHVADCDYWMRAGRHHRFSKIEEFLAVERDHALAQRYRTSQSVWDELTRVRARYVKRSRRRDRLRWRLRRAIFNRYYMLSYVMRSATGRRTGAWSNMIATRSLRWSWPQVLLNLVPRIGPAIAGSPLARDRRWLEPPDTTFRRP